MQEEPKRGHAEDGGDALRSPRERDSEGVEEHPSGRSARGARLPTNEREPSIVEEMLGERHVDMGVFHGEAHASEADKGQAREEGCSRDPYPLLRASFIHVRANRC